MLIELQEMFSNESFLSKYRQLSDDITEWNLVLQNSNPENGISLSLS